MEIKVPTVVAFPIDYDEWDFGCKADVNFDCDTDFVELRQDDRLLAFSDTDWPRFVRFVNEIDEYVKGVETSK